MAKSGTVSIDIAGPPYTVTFSGAAARVHMKGHLWLKADDPGFQVTFNIRTKGFAFDDGGTGNAKKAIFTGTQPNPGSFSKCGGVFGDPTFNGTMSLSLSIANNDEGKYYYRLNFVDTTAAATFHMADPIIINN